MQTSFQRRSLKTLIAGRVSNFGTHRKKRHFFSAFPPNIAKKRSISPSKCLGSRPPDPKKVACHQKKEVSLNVGPKS